MQYDQAANFTKDNKATISIGQTRNGKNEWITPVAMWELDPSGLYLPPGESANPKAPRVTLNGRKAGVSDSSYDQAISAAASGGTATISVIPAAGELWRIKSIYFYLPPPPGATSGTHELLIGMRWPGTAYAILDVIIPYNRSFMVCQNVVAPTSRTGAITIIPFDEVAQAAAITNLVATNASPLVFYYVNSTNVAQSRDMNLRLTKEVEYIA